MIRECPTLRQQQELNWAALQSFRTLASRVLEDLQKQQLNSNKNAVEDDSQSTLQNVDRNIEAVTDHVISDLENLNAHLFSIEALMERIFDVKVPDIVEKKFIELAGELAPDPLNPDRLRLNRLLHQTPDLPDKN